MVTKPNLSRLIVVVLLLGLLTAACGDDGSSDAGGSSDGGSDTATAGEDSGEWPVTIDHAFGTTTIEQRPERIVSLNVQWTDALLALDETPAAYLVDRAVGEEGPYPWNTDLLADVTPVEGVTDGLPYEKIAALRPDLLLVTYGALDQAAFDRLSAIAPTIGMLGERDVDPWQDQIEVLARVLGKEDRARAVIDEVESQVSDAAAQLGGLGGKTFALANYLPGDSIWVVADPEDGSSVFFQQLGMEMHPDLLGVADGATGRVQLSFEQVDLLDADLLVILPNDGDPHDLPGYNALPAVADGAVAELDFAEVVGLNTPTPLSIPFALDLVMPALEAAAS